MVDEVGGIATAQPVKCPVNGAHIPGTLGELTHVVSSRYRRL
jgi:hypothetical protein